MRTPEVPKVKSIPLARGGVEADDQEDLPRPCLKWVSGYFLIMPFHSIRKCVCVCVCLFVCLFVVLTAVPNDYILNISKDQ